MKPIVRFLAIALVLASPLSAQNPRYANKRVPFEPGFRVFIVPDMEGMAGVVKNSEIIAGNEGERYKGLSHPDYQGSFRDLLTRDMNAVIAGARKAGAASFVVNEGHGGNLFASVLPWELDPEAILVRGFPKPLVMMTGIDSTFGTVMFTGMHAGPGSGGIIAHNFAFDSFTVNGKYLNEVGINGLIAGDLGVSVSLVSGDDILIGEARQILGNDFIAITTKIAVGPNAAISYSPEKVRRMLQAGAEEAVRREQRGDFKPFNLTKPYRIEFKLRTSYPETMIAGMDAIMQRYNLEKLGPRTYRMTTSEAKTMGYLLDAIEEMVLR